jgi:hypothetical protein
LLDSLLQEKKMAPKLPAVPETLLKRRKRQAENRAVRAKDALKVKVARKAKRVEIFKRAEKYAKEYQDEERQEIKLKRDAKKEARLYLTLEHIF